MRLVLAAVQQLGRQSRHSLQRMARPLVEAKAMSTYRAVHAVSPGKLELTEKPLLDPPACHVRIRVEACGVCHSDTITVGGLLPIQWPRGARPRGWTGLLIQRALVGFAPDGALFFLRQGTSP